MIFTRCMIPQDCMPMRAAIVHACSWLAGWCISPQQPQQHQHRPLTPSRVSVVRYYTTSYFTSFFGHSAWSFTSGHCREPPGPIFRACYQALHQLYSTCKKYGTAACLSLLTSYSTARFFFRLELELGLLAFDQLCVRRP